MPRTPNRYAHRSTTRTKWWIAVALGLLIFGLAAPKAFAQQARVDSVIAATRFAGVWEARSPNPAYAGTLFPHLELQQRGDSVMGTVRCAMADLSRA